MITNCFKKFDYFSTPFELKVYNQSTLSSNLGLFFTVIIIGIVLGSTITFGSDLYYKNKPKVSSNNIYQHIPKNYTLAENKFAFAFNFNGDYKTFFNDKRYFNIELKNYKRVMVKDKKTGELIIDDKRVTLEHEFCDDNYEYQKSLFNAHAEKNRYNFDKELINSKFNESICLKNNSVTIGGEYNSGFFSNIYFEITKCENSTSENDVQTNLICASDKEQNDLISGRNFNLIFTNYISNTDNYTHPFYSVLDSFFVKLDGTIYQQVDFYFRNEEILTDNGFVFKNIVVNEVTTKNDIREVMTVTPPKARVLRFYLNIGKNKIQIKRFYMKAQELAALVGGIIKLCIIVAQLICRFFNKYQFDINLINHLFITNDKFGIENEIKLKSNSKLNYFNYENKEESNDLSEGNNKSHCRTTHTPEDNHQAEVKSIIKSLSTKNKNYEIKLSGNKSKIKNTINEDSLNQSKTDTKQNSVNFLINNKKNNDSSDYSNKCEIEQKLSDTKRNIHNLNDTKAFDKVSKRSSKESKKTFFKKYKTIKVKQFPKKEEEDTDFSISYLDILLINICFFSPKYQILSKKLEFYRQNLLKRTDYSEVLTAILSFNEFEKKLNEIQAN